MGLLYVNENGAQIGYEANKCVVGPMSRFSTS